MRIFADLTAYRYMKNRVLKDRFFDWRRVPTASNQDLVLQMARTNSCSSIARGLPRNTLGTPLHYLVASDALRRNSSLVRCHVWSGPLPPDALIPIGGDSFITSPAFLLALRARGKTLPELLLEAQLLLGTHVLVPTKRGCKPCVPLCAKSSIESLAGSLRGVRGAALLRDVAELSLENAASLPESMLGALFHLPCRKGGFGLETLELNHEVPTPQGSELRFGKPKRKCDLFVPGIDLDIEYESDECHSSDAERKSDAVRRNQLEMAGVTVLSITSDQLFDHEALSAIARDVYRRLGRRWNMSPAWLARSTQLHRDLLRAKDAMKAFE